MALTDDETALLAAYHDMLANVPDGRDDALTLVILVPVAAAVVDACGGQAEAIDAMKRGAMDGLIARATRGGTTG